MGATTNHLASASLGSTRRRLVRQPGRRITEMYTTIADYLREQFPSGSDPRDYLLNILRNEEVVTLADLTELVARHSKSLGRTPEDQDLPYVQGGFVDDTSIAWKRL